jgi:hypothetical protein
MNRIYPAGAKPAIDKWFMTVVFAIAVVCLSSATGAAQTKTQKPCSQPTNTELTDVAAESPLGPATMGYFFGGYRGFDGGFALTNGVSAYTIVSSAYDSLMTQIVGKTAPTVAVNDPTHSQPTVQSGPCVATAAVKQ